MIASSEHEPVSPQSVSTKTAVGPQAEGEMTHKSAPALDVIPRTSADGYEIVGDEDDAVYAGDEGDEEEVPINAEPFVPPESQDGSSSAPQCEPCEDDIQPWKTGPSPLKPSAEEVEEHRITHHPYRSWCQWCVWGKALGERRGQGNPEHTIAIVGIDYFYLIDGDIIAKDDVKQEPAELEGMRQRKEVVKAIIIRCYMTKAVFAHTIPCKGDDEDGYVVSLITAAAAWLGHTKLILKADNEPAIQALATAALRAMRTEV